MIQASNGLQDWYNSRSGAVRAALLGLTIGVTGGLIGLLLAALSPIIAVGIVLGGLAGLYVLTSVSSAL